MPGGLLITHGVALVAIIGGGMMWTRIYSATHVEYRWPSDAFEETEGVLFNKDFAVGVASKLDTA